MIMSSVTNLTKKFRGCLIGGLIGDCLGSPFEGENLISRFVLKNYMTKHLEETNKTPQMMPYTDDTAMTKSMAESLIQMKGFDAKDMAKRFTLEYMKEPKRGYGSNVIDVFVALKHTNYEHPFEPARRQFKGSGSYGNGGAMRAGPLPLFGFNLSDKELAELSVKCSQITHSNRNGYNGAVLQCFAIREALKTVPKPMDNSFDVNIFINNLIEKFEKIESKNIENEINGSEDNNESNKLIETPFTDKLNKIKQIFADKSKVEEMSAEKVAYLLGNDVSALKSVPSAIFSVLRSQLPLRETDHNFQSDNPFVRTLYFAISLGGDTDTIASMACSIAGALYGSVLYEKSGSRTPADKHP